MNKIDSPGIKMNNTFNNTEIADYIAVLKKSSNDYKNGDTNNNLNDSTFSDCSYNDSVNSANKHLKYESLIDKINKRIESKKLWFSLEFFPPKTVNGAANLISK
jgi:hypothetical protein